MLRISEEWSRSLHCKAEGTVTFKLKSDVYAMKSTTQQIHTIRYAPSLFEGIIWLLGLKVQNSLRWTSGDGLGTRSFTDDATVAVYDESR